LKRSDESCDGDPWEAAMATVKERAAAAVRVLVVDDHPMIRHGLTVALRHDPAIQQVEEAGNAEDALALARQHVFDVAVVDILMPRTSGVRVTGQLREVHPQCRVLALSVIDDPGLIADMFRAQASGFAFKTQPVAEIVQAMQDVLAGKRYLPPSVPPDVIDAELGGEAASELRRLSRREQEIFELLIRGCATADIAAQLCISPRTVESHRQRISKKLSISSVHKMRSFAVRYGCLET
jgi:DNA-binding NarL/FixJ family response regulator